MKSTSSLLSILAIAVMSGACKQDSVQVYQAPKDPAPAADSTSADASAAPAAPQTSGESASDRRGPPPWTVPEGWTTKEPGGMRVASYGIKSADGREADMSVVAMNGIAGGDFQNVNRWRREIGLEEIDEAAVTAAGQPVKIGVNEAKMYDLIGKTKAEGKKWIERTVVAPLEADGMTIFFKMRGEKDIVGENKDKFIALLNSVKVGPPSSTTPPSTDAPTAAAPTAPAAPAAGGSGGAGLPKWTVPDGWLSAAPGPMVLASFQAPNNVAITVSSLGPRAGGALANINRWRGQVGLEPVSTADLPTLTSAVELAGGKGMLVDFTGTKTPKGEARPTRLMAIMVEQTDRTWFYKLVGDPDPAGKLKDGFIGFVRSAKY